MSLEIYRDNGFKLFLCNPDKSPATPGFWPKDAERKKYNKATGKEKKNHDWNEPENQITYEAAELLQSMGDMIGACIPDDIIVIDLDRNHLDRNGKPKADGVKTFKDVREKYNITQNITEKTYTVVTARGGYHIFLYAGVNHGISQATEIAPSIDIKTNSGYVIAAGSPGYSVHPDALLLDITELPEPMRVWLETETTKPKKTKPLKSNSKTLIPVSLFKKILNKLDVRKFDSNETWYELIVSSIATAGNTDEVITALSEWSAGDPMYNVNQAETRIRSFETEGEITTGTFIHILKAQNISQYFIKQVLSFNLSVELYENMREDGTMLPFPDPNYDEISDSKESNELFLTAGNSVAATLLGYAVYGHIVYCESEKQFFLFDGNRWLEFNDMFSVAYTVLIRLCKFMFAKKRGSDVAGENFLRLIKAVNKTHWKIDVLKELQCRDGIYHKVINWDSTLLKETLTTQDGVIDFTSDHIITRRGEREEFRKSCVPYNTIEIINSQDPKKYNEFLEGLFPDKDTLFTARQSSSMFISGNPKKVFQVYHGSGDNGKSTWIEIEKELLGSKAHTYSTSLILSNKFGDEKLPTEVTEFIGKYVLFGSEVEKGKVLSLGKIKNFTGGDTIGARPLYEKERTFAPTWQMVLSINDLPFFDGTDRAFVNRLLVLPFEKIFVNSEQTKKEIISKGYDENLVSLIIDSDKLKSEIRGEFPAVIYQKINDYLDLKNNYNGVIVQSRKCKAHKESYIFDNNDIENFLTDMCQISIEDKLFVSSEEITEAYKTYCGDSKISSSFVVRAIMKSRQEVTRDTQVISIEVPAVWDKRVMEKAKVQKRGLKNIRLKTLEEIEAAKLAELRAQDDIPF